MEKEEYVFLQYFLLVWKRKIFIAAMTLFCVVIAVGIVLARPTLYRTETLLRIGKGQTTNVPTLIDEPNNLRVTIPIKYGSFLGTNCSLAVETLGNTPLIRVNVVGRDREEATESLKQVVDNIVKDHKKRSEELIGSYKVLASGIGEYIEATGEQLSQFGVSDKKTEALKKGNALEVRIVDELWNKREGLVDLKRKAESKMFVNSLRTNMTQVVGGIPPAVPLKPSMEKYVIASGIFGLTISVLIILIGEYKRNAFEAIKSINAGRKKGD